MVTALRKLLARLLALSLLIVSSAISAVEVNISVDKNPVASGSSFTLTVIADDHLSRTAWQPEQQLDQFRVLSTSVSSSTQIVNGASSRSTEFRTLLQAPTAPGRYQIGPLQVGGASTNVIALEVLPLSAQQQAEQAPAAFMEVSLDRNELYVQQQLQLTATLYLGANLLSGNILPPELDNAEINQLGKDQESYEMRNGKRFQVFKRTYLITPQRSGDLVITAPVFTGQINSGRSLSPFTGMNSSEAVTTAAQQLPITVLPVPPEWPADASWLPAELATISVELADGNSGQGKVGEPLSLNYRVTAIGVQSDLLAPLQLAPLANADSYPEPSQRQTSERNGKLIAQQLTQVAIIPQQSGRLLIPAQQLTWFNTVTRRVERSLSQPIEIEIAAASGLQPQVPQQQQREPIQATEPASAQIEYRHDAGWWPYVTLALALLWLVTTGVLWRQLQRLRQRPVSAPAHTVKPALQLKQLQRACESNSALQAESALKLFAEQQLGLRPPLLPALAQYFQHAPLKSQLEHLSQCRYASASAPWQEGKALWRALQAAQRQLQTQQTDALDALPKLYPPSR